MPLVPRMISGWSERPGRRSLGISMRRVPLRYWPVSEAGSAAIASAVPWAPWPPAKGFRSRRVWDRLI
ncbi:hypothetical protein CCR96_17225 [Halochromatium roseum]|nr:hypothetical protein [Halochromatium roseum]